MNRHVRNHVRHMFYNDYNRRHPKPRRDKSYNKTKKPTLYQQAKEKNKCKNFISKDDSIPMLLVETIGMILLIVGFLYLCHISIIFGVLMIIVSVLSGMIPLAVIIFIAMIL